MRYIAIGLICLLPACGQASYDETPGPRINNEAFEVAAIITGLALLFSLGSLADSGSE